MKELDEAYTESNQYRPRSNTNLQFQLLHIIQLTVAALVPELAESAGYRQ